MVRRLKCPWGIHRKANRCTEVGTRSPAHALAVGYPPTRRVTWTVCLELLRICTRRDPHLGGLMPFSCPKEVSKSYLSAPSNEFGLSSESRLGLLLALFRTFGALEGQDIDGKEDVLIKQVGQLWRENSSMLIALNNNGTLPIIINNTYYQMCHPIDSVTHS